MAEYRIEFAQSMCDCAKAIVASGFRSEDARRATLYVSLVACEIALKAALEKAGIQAQEIKKRRHNLSKLLDDLDSCTIPVEVAPGTVTRVPASRIRSIVVDDNYGDATVGALLQGEMDGASKFPNEIRYGEIVKHFPASVMAKLSEKVVAWVRQYYDEIQS